MSRLRTTLRALEIAGLSGYTTVADAARGCLDDTKHESKERQLAILAGEMDAIIEAATDVRDAARGKS